MKLTAYLIRTRLPVPANLRSTCFTRSSAFASSSEPAQAKRGANNCLVTAFENCLCGSLFRCRRQVLAPAFSDLVLILHPHPLNHSHRCAGQAGENSVPRPMLTGAGLGLRDGLSVPVSKSPSPARLRYALPCLTLAMLDYRPICAQFEYRLMSLRRLVITLRAPSPAVRLGCSFIRGCLGAKAAASGKRVPAVP